MKAKTNQEKIKIPQKYIHKGYHRQEKHIQRLLASSQTLYDSEDYSASLVFSIIAFEELSKLRLLQEHLKSGKGIIKKDWNELNQSVGMHTKKESRLYELSRKNLQKMPKERYDKIAQFWKSKGYDKHPTYEQILSLDGKFEKRLHVLNDVKKLCLYFSWEQNNWHDFSDHFSDLDLEATAFVQLIDAQFFFHSMCGLRIHDKIKPLDEIFNEDPHAKEYQKFSLIKISNEYDGKLKSRENAFKQLRKMNLFH